MNQFQTGDGQSSRHELTGRLPLVWWGEGGGGGMKTCGVCSTQVGMHVFLKCVQHSTCKQMLRSVPTHIYACTHLRVCIHA